MQISQAFPSNYLKAADLQGREANVVIDRVEMEPIGQGDKKENKPVIYFQGKEKGVVLNKTNSFAISDAYGDNTDDWTGQPVILFCAWVDFQGRSVEAIRIRVPKRTPVRVSSGPQAAARSAPPARAKPVEPSSDFPGDDNYRPSEPNDELPF